jgi:CHASE3 domain sensor protein
MSMQNDRILSADELGEVVSTLARLASRQQNNCDELLRKLETAVNTFESRTVELTRDMPNKIAKRAAQDVVQRIADEVKRSVTDVLQPADAKAQTLLSAMEKAVEEYRRAAGECRSAVLICIIAAAVSAVLLILAMMRMTGIV